MATSIVTSIISVESQTISISDEDRILIDEIRSKLADELKLVPGYETEASIMRWLMGWSRNVDQILPKFRAALLAIHALRLPEQDFSTIDKIVDYCDSISEAATYLPGTLIGRDRVGNIVTLQVLGHLDGHGLMKSVCIGDLYISRVAESEGVMNLLREHENLTGQQLGTVIIIDLEHLSREGITLASIKVISIMLSQLQEMFPDVLRKVLIIHAPIWISTVWSIIHPVLARQTRQKIEFLGADWKEKLQVYIDKSVLFEHWGGTRSSSNPCGNVRMGGRVPEKLYYSPDKETVDLSDVQKINVPARSKIFVDIKIAEEDSKLGWWWQTTGGDLDFWIVKIGDDQQETIIWPKFRLLTSYVPENREIRISEAGLYRLYFGNLHGRIFSKDIRYKTWTL